MKTVRLLVLALFVVVAVASQAATVTNTYYVTASGFHNGIVEDINCLSVPAPVDPVTLAFSVSFDNSANVPFTTANFTLISLNMPNEGPLGYSYFQGFDELSVGNNALSKGHNYFLVTFKNISAGATFLPLTYTVSSPAAAAKCEFESARGTITVGPPWTHLTFPMTGIRLGQTIRLNFVAGPVPVPGPGPCEARLNIYDAVNNLIASQSVTPSGSVAFDYSLRSAIAGTGRGVARKELRPEVILMPGTPAAGACQGQATAEVYDDLTKSTSVIVPAEANPGPINLPAVQFGPVGVGFLQTVRLNVVAFPPNSCSGTLSFTDTEGNPMGTPKSVSLTGGQASFIDLPGTAIPSDSGHGEVMAAFTQTPGAAPGACIPSVEVYDTLTGGTQVTVNPGPTQ